MCERVYYFNVLDEGDELVHVGIEKRWDADVQAGDMVVMTHPDLTFTVIARAHQEIIGEDGVSRSAVVVTGKSEQFDETADE